MPVVPQGSPSPHDRDLPKEMSVTATRVSLEENPARLNQAWCGIARKKTGQFDGITRFWRCFGYALVSATWLP